ncbi:hypothetical protein E4L95_16835 [Paracoccus liaowanqingii]|uniref:Uncharacterized protein n=1 Tax=Paracoccus liaowanqingii TaxID=2560053 RepID=A0A4Z1BSD6_9RHOB|nr:hypothetical protein [Paracoccus liaowanqingii]TGN51325.1 hypothetical protein E4L95_16835 [Paracoccus liaowanqingii]
MDAYQFKAAIDGMSEGDLLEVINAFKRARTHALQLKHSARLPERAAFGAIAVDLDYSLGLICRILAAQHTANDTEANDEQAGMQSNYSARADPKNSGPAVYFP